MWVGSVVLNIINRFVGAILEAFYISPQILDNFFKIYQLLSLNLFNIHPYIYIHTYYTFLFWWVGAKVNINPYDIFYFKSLQLFHLIVKKF